jgi:hypothetical protein
MTAFRRVALLEATSFLALLVASYVKHQDGGDLGVSILGPIHGGLFIVYVILALMLRGLVGADDPPDTARRRRPVRRVRRRRLARAPPTSAADVLDGG